MTQKYLQAFVKICCNWRLLSILQLKVLNPFRDRGQHILALIIKDRASLHFVKKCDDFFGTHAFLFQLVILVIAPVIIENLFDLITCNFWILNRINAVFSDPLSLIDFEFIDHWLRRWKIFVEIDVFYSRYIRSDPLLELRIPNHHLLRLLSVRCLL